MVEEQTFDLQLQIDVIMKRQSFSKLTEATIKSKIDGHKAFLHFFPALLFRIRIRIFGSRIRIGICIKVKKWSHESPPWRLTNGGVKAHNGTVQGLKALK
jgi:hypothetical protein